MDKRVLLFIQNMINLLLEVPVTYVEKTNRIHVEFKELPPPGFLMESIRTPVFDQLLGTMRQGIIYHVIDRFKLQYSVLYMDEPKDKGYLILGPYQTTPITKEEIVKILKKNGADEPVGSALEWYYSRLPVIDPQKIQPCMTMLAEYITPDKTVAYKRIIDNPDKPPTMVQPYTAAHSDSQFIERLEQRRFLENLVLTAIEKGNRKEAMEAYKRHGAFQKNTGCERQAQRFETARNNSIANNALYRKAAEKGSVHPVYLDIMYHKFIREIAQCRTFTELNETDYNMLICYCDLVHKMSLKNHGPIVRQAINYIRININGDLRLSSIAHVVNVSANYFSTIWNHEMEVSLSDYVNQVRINEAMLLFELGKTSVNEVAGLSGYRNVNYFAKVFRKFNGASPTEYIRLCRQKTDFNL